MINSFSGGCGHNVETTEWHKYDSPHLDHFCHYSYQLINQTNNISYIYERKGVKVTFVA